MMMNGDFMLKTDRLCKKFGKIDALKNVTLSFSENGIYGVFGRNGAGKTTFLNIITARTFADSGAVFFGGKDIVRYPQLIAENCCYLQEKNYFPARFRIKRLLDYGKATFPNFDEKYAEKLCARFKLDTDRKYGDLSGGYRSIFKIVLGLAARTGVTVFDEPVLGLDAVARDMFYLELIEEYSENPRLFIISTHLIEEFSRIFNEAVIIRTGEVILQESVEDLLLKVFYVSGRAALVDDFIRSRQVIHTESVNDLKMAVIKGELNGEKRVSGLNFSPITVQNLFISLTNDTEKEE